MCMGLPEKREDQDQSGDGEADAQAVAEGLPGVGGVAAEGARKAEKVIIDTALKELKRRVESISA